MRGAGGIGTDDKEVTRRGNASYPRVDVLIDWVDQVRKLGI